jgi:signal transduction histidine kinase
MRNPHSGEATTQTVHELTDELTGLFDPTVLGQQAVKVLARQLHLPLTSFALLDDRRSGVYAMTSTVGARTDEFPAIRLRHGQGLGGRVVAERALFAVEDYTTDERISDDFRAIVGREQLRGMAAAPIICDGDDGEPIGLLYGSKREVGRLGDRVLDTLEASANAIAPVLDASMQAQQNARLRVSEERQRLAGTLHDEVAQLLFSINTSASRALELGGADSEQANVIHAIQRDAQDAAEQLRVVLEELAPSSPLETVPAAAQQDVDAFSERSGVPAYLILRGSVATLPRTAERVLTACLRQTLFNIEQHARATLVVVTLDYQADGTYLVVQDDGQGVPASFEVPAVPSGAHNWGHPSMVRQVEQLGGSVSLRPVDDGGARFCAWVPHGIG